MDPQTSVNKSSSRKHDAVVTYSEESEETDCRFGICFRPKWARNLASPNLLVACYGFLNIVDGMVFMYYVGIMTTFEAQFHLKSESLGMVMSIGELVPIFAALVFGYFCGMGDRPRWISFCAWLTSFGCFIAALPFFIFGAPNKHRLLENLLETNKQDEFNNLCTSAHNSSIFNSTVASVAEDESCQLDSAHEHSTAAIIIYLTGYTIFNCGCVILYVVGTPYMDDNVTQKNSPLYMAIICSLRTIGPMLGFLLSFFCLSFHVTLSQTTMDQNDPQWLGAWWLGYVIMATMAAIGAFFIAQFPKRLPSTHLTPAIEMEQQKSNKEESTNVTGANVSRGIKILNTVKEFFRALRPLFKNRHFLLRTASEIFTLFALESYMLYLPKYLEHQFNIPASDASAWSALCLIAPIVFGDLCVGFYIQQYNPSPRKLALILAITKLLYTIGILLLMFIQCDSAYVTGLHDNFQSASCNIDCDCSVLPFQPVCIDNSHNFLSACHAGCTSINTTTETSFYENCSCAESGNVQPHLCSAICPKFYSYVALTTIVHFILSVDVIAGIIFLFRCVSTEQKTIAMGLSSVFLSSFTFIPSPIIMSAIIDSTCALWDVSCNEHGACLLYDVDKFRHLLHGFPFVLLVCACISDFWFSVGAKELDLYGKEQKDQMPTVDDETQL